MKASLEVGSARVAIDCEHGGRIASLCVAGMEVLVREGPDAMRWGSYPMAPWAGRVRRGRFRFRGEEYQLPLDMPPHAIHGTTYQRPWECEEMLGETGLRLSVDLGPDWPFPGRAVQEIVLAEQGLCLRLEVHAEREPFPASLGWHPWFARELGRGGPLELDFRARSMYARDREGLPSGELITPPPPPWDDCFTDLEADPVLTWPGALRIRLESSEPHWVVYDEPVHAICVEPMTGPPDALNLAPNLVEPGRPLVAEARIRWEEL